MRNIIYTSLCLAMSAGQALADGPALGCYDRTYSKDHLAAHPDQIVSKIRLLIHEQAGFAGRRAALEVKLTSQGHVAGTAWAGQSQGATLDCFTENGTDYCAIECDGGVMEITSQTKETLTFATDYLSIGDREGCGGTVDLAEIPGETVHYRLTAAPMSVCEGMQ